MQPRAPAVPSAPTALIRNGTTTTAHDAAQARLRHETGLRRAAADAMKRQARSTPHEAKLFERSLRGNVEVVIAIVVGAGGEKSVLDWIVGEVLERPDDSCPDGKERGLQIVCPVCVLRHGRPSDRHQLTIWQTNRRWSLDQKRMGELWVNPENRHDVHVIVGVVETHEACTCGVCGARFRIDAAPRSMLGVSGLWREL